MQSLRVGGGKRADIGVVELAERRIALLACSARVCRGVALKLYETSFVHCVGSVEALLWEIWD